MDDYPRLLYRDVAPLRPFHVAAATLKRRGEAEVSRHRHDFHEAMLVVEGQGTHWINGAQQPLDAGQLVLLRPDDCHGITIAGRPRLHFLNVAYPAQGWREFVGLALPARDTQRWQDTGEPVAALLTGTSFEHAVRVFRRLGTVSGQPGERLELVRFWTEIVRLVSDSPPPASAAADSPPWLDRALSAMSGGDLLREGVPALAAVSGVSPAHLSRTLRAKHGVTPTEYVNGLRMRRAALLLANSTMEIAEIALDCGFDNLSYFYRRFRQEFGMPPRAYRLEERRRVAP